ncbi:hypothetical protein ACEPAH_2810 [Sanghuangporus vaninii]
MTVISASSATSSSMTTPTTSTTKPRHHHLFLPTSASSSHISRASTPNSNTPSSSTSPAPSSTLSLPFKSAHQHHGVRAHLAELLPLPRHALFDVKLTIHQLWNVPLVAGEFSVKWKFQHVHRERVGAIRRPGTPSTLTPSGRLTPDSAGFLTLTNNSSNAFGSGWSGWSGSGLGKGKGREVLPPAAAVAADHDSEHDSARSNLIPSGASMLSIPSTSEGSCSSPSLSPRRHSLDLLTETRNNSVASASASGFGNSDGDGDGSANNVNGTGSSSESHSHEARGRTPYVALRDHHVKWGQTVHVTVQIPIQRDTLELQPCELKLVVEQLTNANNSSSLSNPRLGAVFLNLAEYVDKGSVMRRHLLRQSKTNATLQLTLELTHAGGESNYKAPPLQKGEVMAGVSALLAKSAVGGAPRARPAYERTVSRPPVKTHRRGTDRRDVLGIGLALGRGGRGGWNTPTVPTMLGPSELELELEMGGAAVGALKTTENIIEAIFNPVPSSSSAPSPFTYYVPPNPRPRPLTPSGSGSVRSSSMQSVSASANGSGSVSASAGTSGEVDLSADADADGDGGGDGDGEGVTYAEPDSYEERPPSIAPSSARSDHSVPASISLSTTSSHHERDKNREKINIGARSHSSANVNANASANALNAGASASGGKKWWRKFSGLSRPASPAPAPAPVSFSSPSSQLPSPSPIPGYGHVYGSVPASLPSPSPRIGARTRSTGSTGGYMESGLGSSSGPAHTHTHNHTSRSGTSDTVATSVKSSPGILLHENERDSGRSRGFGIEHGDEDDSRNEQSRLPAPQIVVRSPVSATRSPRSPQSPRGGGTNSGSTTRRPS